MKVCPKCGKALVRIPISPPTNLANDNNKTLSSSYWWVCQDQDCDYKEKA